MALKVIGAGYGRTGTGSLRDALELLGYSRCYHMFAVTTEEPDHAAIWEAATRGAEVDWDEIFGDKYQAACDWPPALFYKELLARYPEALVVLTVRDADSWYRSTLDTIYALVDTANIKWTRWLMPGLYANQRMIRGLWDKAYGERTRFLDKDHALARYHAHNDEVKRVVPGDRLLVFDVREGWAPLCGFLGAPVPDTPFPRSNERAAMQHILKRYRLIRAAPWILLTAVAAIVAIWTLAPM